MQSMLRLRKIRDLVHVRRAHQFAIERIGPGVIRTLDERSMSALRFAQTRPAMPANIIKSAERSRLIARHEHALDRDLRHKIIARPRQLALMAHTHPMRRENARLFFREDIGRNKVALRQSLRARGRGWHLPRPGGASDSNPARRTDGCFVGYFKTAR